MPRRLILAAGMPLRAVRRQAQFAPPSLSRKQWQIAAPRGDLLRPSASLPGGVAFPNWKTYDSPRRLRSMTLWGRLLRSRESITVALAKGTVPFSSDENRDSPPVISALLLICRALGRLATCPTLASSRSDRRRGRSGVPDRRWPVTCRRTPSDCKRGLDRRAAAFIVEVAGLS